MPNQGIGGIAAINDFVVVSSRDRADQQDVFTCLDAGTGLAFWQFSYPASGELDYGNSPRATPLIADPYVIVLGAFGNLHCLDLETGDVVWKKNMIQDLDGKLPQWGYSASPLVIDNHLIVQPGGVDSSIVALSLQSGEVVWKTPGREAAYASLVKSEIDGRTQVIGFDAKTVSGWDVNSGERLWEVQPAIKSDFNVPTAVLVENGIVLTSENNATRIHYFESDGRLQKEPAAEFQDMAGDSHTPVRLGQYLVGVDRELYVLEVEKDLALAAKFSDKSLNDYCSLIACEDRVLVTCNNGDVILLRVSEGKIEERGRLKLSAKSAQILAHPAISGTTYFVRLAKGIEAWDLSDTPVAP